MSDLPHAIGKATTRLAAIEQEIASGTWHPTTDTLTVIVRHTLGIVAALQAAVIPAEGSVSNT